MASALSRRQSPESKLWGKLRKASAGQAHMFRVENTASSGTFDVNYAMTADFNGRSAQGWIELKIATSGKFHMRKFQLGFASSRLKATGGIGCWILCYEKPNIMLVHASKVLDLNYDWMERRDNNYVSVLTKTVPYDVLVIGGQNWGMIFDHLREEAYHDDYRPGIVGAGN